MAVIWVWVADEDGRTRSGVGVSQREGDLGISAAVGDHRGTPPHEPWNPERSRPGREIDTKRWLPVVGNYERP